MKYEAEYRQYIHDNNLSITYEEYLELVVAEKDNKRQSVNPQMLILGRGLRGLSQRELAEYTGISVGKISRYEGGVKTPTYDELKIMSKVLQLPVLFFFREGKIYPPAHICQIHGWGP